MPGKPQQRSLTSFFSPKTTGNPASKGVPAAATTAGAPDPEATMRKKSNAGSRTDSKRAAERDDDGAVSSGGAARAAAVAAGKEDPKRQRLEDSPTPPGGLAGAAREDGKDKLASDEAPVIKEKGWDKALSCETSKPYFRRLQTFLDAQYSSKVIFPPREQIFNAFESCPLHNVKVVILGQDPYHQPGQAHGLAFSVMKGVPQPPSLRNMVKEAVSCCGIRPTKAGTLDSWCGQGVLLLNTVLTVERSKAHSHKKQGWETFTDAVVREVNKGNRRVVFMLWGKPSQKKGALIDARKHRVVTCAHPSPLSATKGPDPFIGSACFKKANDALAELGHSGVDWNVE